MHNSSSRRLQRRAEPGRPPAPATTVPAAFAAAIEGADPAQPLITWYDDETGERTELSGDTLGNWVAKTANLLVDGCGLGASDPVVVDAPPHWQTAAVLLGCWTAGLHVAQPASPAGVVFAAADRARRYVAPGTEVFGLALAPLAAPMRLPPEGVSDFVVEARAHGDHFRPSVPVGADAAALTGSGSGSGSGPSATVRHAELCGTAFRRAEELGIRAGDRVLVDAAAYPDLLDWLLAWLVAGGSLVLCANLDAARLPDRAATERVTVRLT